MANHLRRRISRRSPWSIAVSTKWVELFKESSLAVSVSCRTACRISHCLRRLTFCAQNWKARLSAYTDIIAKSAKTASDSDPFFRPYVSDGPLLYVGSLAIILQS